MDNCWLNMKDDRLLWMLSVCMYCNVTLITVKKNSYVSLCYGGMCTGFVYFNTAAKRPWSVTVGIQLCYNLQKLRQCKWLYENFTYSIPVKIMHNKMINSSKWSTKQLKFHNTLETSAQTQTCNINKIKFGKSTKSKNAINSPIENAV